MPVVAPRWRTTERYARPQAIAPVVGPQRAASPAEQIRLPGHSVFAHAREIGMPTIILSRAVRQPARTGAP